MLLGKFKEMIRGRLGLPSIPQGQAGLEGSGGVQLGDGLAALGLGVAAGVGASAGVDTGLGVSGMGGDGLEDVLQGMDFDFADLGDFLVGGDGGMVMDL